MLESKNMITHSKMDNKVDLINKQLEQAKLFEKPLFQQMLV